MCVGACNEGMSGQALFWKGLGYKREVHREMGHRHVCVPVTTAVHTSASL
jgi:hypothetical protein